MSNLDNPGLIRYAPLALTMHKYGKAGSYLKYRIVHASSRRHLVFPLMGGGDQKWIRKYPLEHQRDSWVMEAWHSIADYALGQNVATYAKTSGICLHEDGEYDICFEFENGVPSEGGLDKLVAWIEMGGKRRPIENALAIRAEWDQQEKDKDARLTDRIAGLIPAFGAAPMAGAGGARGTKTRDFKIGAHQTPFQNQTARALPKVGSTNPIVFQGSFGQKRSHQIIGA